ncbi:polysaccharide deacetylase family protein [Kribbella sp. CA-293567]|uniref:polysaccharide deacetylase family protein n=1 Tax=Kribbella sp. CA-293567 TaxID=3002436 RepID=UPI0022DE84A2|nr:polysaccharide deacetylase family protein [Kribbella sp. CA-293567]WBQ03690.1 polysaccharide deacetylase family protein [Kribbella sp. CA-293567]
MTLPPGKLFLVAALLFGAALVQAANPSGPSPSGNRQLAAGPAGRTPAKPIQSKFSKPKPGSAKPGHRAIAAVQKNQRTGAPATDDWTLGNDGKVIYLTFDDGPQPVFTPKVLAVLARHRAKATFFVLGKEAAAHPELVGATRAQGHTVGNHTWDHQMLTRLIPRRMHEEIFNGVKSKCFRPPYRDTNAAVAKVAAANHQRQVLWDVDTKDWEKPGAARIERAILHGAYPGAVVLMHDGGGNRTETVAALNRALPQLRARGYTFRALPC